MNKRTELGGEVVDNIVFDEQKCLDLSQPKVEIYSVSEARGQNGISCECKTL